MIYGMSDFLPSKVEKNFDLVKENVSLFPFVFESLVPVELWNELILKHIISPIGNVIRMDHKSKEVSKGLFA